MGNPRGRGVLALHTRVEGGTPFFWGGGLKIYTGPRYFLGQEICHVFFKILKSVLLNKSALTEVFKFCILGGRKF